MDITELLAFSAKEGASDLHISAGLPPIIRIDGDVRRINLPPMEHRQVHSLIYEIMNDKQRRDYEEFLETDFSFDVPGVARFRVNVFNQNRGSAAVFRTIPSQVLTLEQLGMGDIFRKVSLLPRGLVLVTGPTGSGKSTTLAAMVDYINENRYDHILTIEDPIEFVHQNPKNACLTSGKCTAIPWALPKHCAPHCGKTPTSSWWVRCGIWKPFAWRSPPQKPATLVFGTLHTTSAAKTIDRVVDVFPAGEKPMVRSMLSESLQAVISQSLMKKNRRRPGGRA